MPSIPLFRPSSLGAFALCLAGLFLMVPPCLADAPENYPFVSYDEGLRDAKAQGKPLFLYFGRYGCTWCDITNKRAFVDPEVRSRYVERYVLVYVDTESGRRLTLPSGERITEAELGARMKVYATPLFAFLDPDANPLGSTYGVKTIDDLLAMDRFVAEGHYRSLSLGQFLRDR